MFKKPKSLPSAGVYKRKYTSSSGNTSKRGRRDDNNRNLVRVLVFQGLESQETPTNKNTEIR